MQPFALLFWINHGINGRRKRCDLVILTGGVEAPLEEQPGAEEKPVELAMFGRAGSAASNFVQRMLFGDGLFKSRAILEDLKSGKREKLNLADMFVDPDASAEESKTIPSLFVICQMARRSKST